MTQLAYSIEDICKITGIGRTKIYEAMNSGRLKARKLDGRTVVLKEDLDSFLKNLEPYISQKSSIQN